MIEQIDQDHSGQAAQPIQAMEDSSGQPNVSLDLDALTDQQLCDEIQRLSNEIAERKAQEPMKADLSWMEQVEWEAAICCALFQRESLQLALIYRGIEKLGQDPALQTYTHRLN
jgi:hypothetical protein